MDSQAVGINISVGIKIFSIVKGSGFEADLFHGCGQWRLITPAPRLLRKLKMSVESWVAGKNLLTQLAMFITRVLRTVIALSLLDIEALIKDGVDGALGL